LIGERLMEAEDPAVALKELLLTDSD
jgi:hypothetical protein